MINIGMVLAVSTDKWIWGSKMVAQRLLKILASGLTALVLASTIAPVATARQADPAPLSAPVSASSNTPYRLGVGDKLRLIVFGEAALTGEFDVSSQGTVALPLIGEIKAAGLTTSELQVEVAKILREGYLNDPRVSLEVLNYRPFYVLGEVNKAGEYPYTNGLTVDKAVATANGFTYRADKKKVYVRRAGQSVEEVLPARDTVVLPGDTIRIGERHF